MAGVGFAICERWVKTYKAYKARNLPGKNSPHNLWGGYRPDLSGFGRKIVLDAAKI
jgi:hypothetical protein